MWSLETSFFSKFSVRQLLEKHQSSAGLSCDAVGGSPPGGGVGFGHVGSLRSGHAQFNSSKSDSCGCRMNSNEAFDEASLFASLKGEVEQALHDVGAEIRDSGSSGAANFHFSYVLKNVKGRVELSGTRIGNQYYNVSANLHESGN
jgi:hypothetical protein